MSRKNTIDELEAAAVFIQVVRAQGFTQAARVLGRSAPQLSRIVAALEDHLGAQLLLRTTRRHHLTEAGALYLSHAEGLLAAQRAAHDAVAELSGGVPRGLLRVSMPVTVGERLLGPHLPAFRRRYPELRLEVDLSDRNVPLVQGGFDLAIRVGRMAESTLRAHPLGAVPVRVVACPALLRDRGTPQRPADLARWPCVTVGVSAGPVEWTFWRRDDPAELETIAVEGAIHTSSPALAAQLATLGEGLLRTTEWVIRAELERGDLQEVLPAWTCDHPRYGGVPVSVLYAQSAGVTPPLKSRVFVRMVRDVMEREVLAPLRGDTLR